MCEIRYLDTQKISSILKIIMTAGRTFVKFRRSIRAIIWNIWPGLPIKKYFLGSKAGRNCYGNKGEWPGVWRIGGLCRIPSPSHASRWDVELVTITGFPFLTSSDLTHYWQSIIRCICFYFLIKITWKKLYHENQENHDSTYNFIAFLIYYDRVEILWLCTTFSSVK